MQRPERLLASFTGSGVLGATPMLRVLEALEQRGVQYHKVIPAVSEVAHERQVEDRAPPIGQGGFATRTVQVEWRAFHAEAPLDQDGLDAFRRRLSDLPTGLRGLRVRLGYAFPKRDPEPVEVTFHVLDGSRWEASLSVPADRVLDREAPKLARANGLLVADLAEAMVDALGPPYGALRLDAGVLQDQLPDSGWGFYCSALVEVAGRAATEAFAKDCYRSWELADGGWFLAPRPFDEPSAEASRSLAALFAGCRHLTLEAMRGCGWKAD